MDKPAFPVQAYINEYGNERAPVDGLTRRELFAAMAMQAYLSNPSMTEKTPDKTLASWARHSADALITELEKSDDA